MKKVLIVMLIVSMLLLSGCFALPETTQSSQVSTTSTTTSAATTTQTAARVTNTETRATTTKATTLATTTKATTTEATTTEPVTPDELDAFCTHYKYKDIARMPDDYEGEYIKFSGEVVQVMEDGDYTMLRIAEDGDYDQMWFILYLRPEGMPRILDDDQVDVYGLCMGLYTYESTSGMTVSIPGATTEWIFLD